MKFSLSIKIIVILSVFLLCAGVGVYSFMRLNSVEQRKDFNLYTLVPQDAVAVFETDRMVDMLEVMGRMKCSEDGHNLHASYLFSCLKKYLDTLMAETPHALSKQMNKILISFHTPDTQADQILYCTLGEGDRDLLENFIRKYCPESFPVKTSKYRGQEIRIYPMNNGQFLAVYLTQDFLALSFQKKLLEKVIDARKDGHSLPDEPSFKILHSGKIRNVEASLYLRTRSVHMGLPTDTLRPVLNLGEWMEFDMKFTEKAIYCTGLSHETDTVHSLVRALRPQESLSGFAGERLPSSTYLYTHWSMSEKDSLFAFQASQVPYDNHTDPYPSKRDRELQDFLKANADTSLLTCFFLTDYPGRKTPCTVSIIPLTNEWKARQDFLNWLRSTPHDTNAPSRPRFTPGYDRYPHSQAYRKYLMPRNTLVTRLTGWTDTLLYSYACFYRGCLLLSPDALSLSAYIEALEGKNNLTGSTHYEVLASSLAPSYNLLLMADMDEVLRQPAAWAHLVPGFFLQHEDFFRYFVLAIQFNNQEGTVCPNLTLWYRPEDLPEKKESSH